MLHRHTLRSRTNEKKRLVKENEINTQNTDEAIC